jgi:plastocyanin
MLPRVAIAVFALALLGTALAGPAVGVRGAHAARTVQVAVKDDFYSPSSLTVTTGTRVRWVWKGRDPHNVTVTSGPTDFASSTKRKGDFARTLKKAGTYRIVCTVHDQRMKLVVRKPR